MLYTVSGNTYRREDAIINYDQPEGCWDMPNAEGKGPHYYWDLSDDHMEAIEEAAKELKEIYLNLYDNVGIQTIRADGLNYSKPRIHLFYTEDGEEYADVVEVDPV